MRKLGLVLLLAFTGWGNLACAESAAQTSCDVSMAGVLPDDPDATARVQALLDSGRADLFFPRGVYQLGTIYLPENSRLQFGPGAVWKIRPDLLQYGGLIFLKGNNITVSGIQFDLTKSDGTELTRVDLPSLISGTGYRGLLFDRLVVRQKGAWRVPPTPPQENAVVVGLNAITLENCRDIRVERCEASNLFALVFMTGCVNATVTGNSMKGGRYMATFRYGGESFRHFDNWSSGVTDQAQWWGGDANDAKVNVPKKTANIVQRDIKSDHADYEKMTAGVYDVIVQNNYAEYGRTLAWGSKGRQIIINANIARYMTDMAYDAEGCENVIFSNNISINSKTAGIGCYFWSEKVVITGNSILVQNGDDPKYQGGFIRLQSLNPKPERQTGSGQVLIQGNLFSSELEDRPRSVLVEAGRDISIFGNKFVNGAVRTKRMELGTLNIQGNDFSHRFAFDVPVIVVQDRAETASVAGNFLRSSAGEAQSAPAIWVSSLAGRWRAIERNTISGWPVSLRAEVPTDWRNRVKSPGTFLVRDNVVSGGIEFAFKDGEARTRTSGNIAESTLEDVNPTTVARQTAAEKTVEEKTEEKATKDDGDGEPQPADGGLEP